MIYLTLKALDEQSQEESVFKEQRKLGRERLIEIIEEIDGFGLENHWPSDLVFRVTLIVEEMVQNILDYGYRDYPGDVKVTVISRANTISIDIVDNAPPFDPLTESPEPDLTSVIEERRIGGLGVYFTRTLMDEVSYKHVSGENRLHIRTAKVRNKKEKAT